MLCREIIFQENERRVKSTLHVFCGSQNRFYVTHPIQSEKYGDAKSYLSSGFIPYFKDKNHIYIENGFADNFFSEFKRYICRFSGYW